MSFQKPEFKTQYANFIGGEWVAPLGGQYFEDSSPVDGSLIARVPQSDSRDIDLAVEAGSKAAGAWGKTSATERSTILNKIADRIEENLEHLALVETWGNGKAIRESMAADIPLSADHFRY